MLLLLLLLGLNLNPCLLLQLLQASRNACSSP
jgi:hypothetical protein